MSLNYSSLKKLFRECFSGDKPLQIPKDGLEEWKQMVFNKLSEFEYIDLERKYYSTSEEKQKLLLHFSIKDTEERYYYSGTDCKLIIGTDYTISIACRGLSAVLSNLDELSTFIAECQKRIERSRILKKKQTKIKQFQTQAIIAQVKKIAKEAKFDFYTSEDSQKLILTVKISEKRAVELEIPFHKFQEILDNLSETITLLKELEKKGVKFRSKTLDSYSIQYENWIHCDS